MALNKEAAPHLALAACVLASRQRALSEDLFPFLVVGCSEQALSTAVPCIPHRHLSGMEVCQLRAGSRQGVKRERTEKHARRRGLKTNHICYILQRVDGCLRTIFKHGNATHELQDCVRPPKQGYMAAVRGRQGRQESITQSEMHGAQPHLFIILFQQKQFRR